MGSTKSISPVQPNSDEKTSKSPAKSPDCKPVLTEIDQNMDCGSDTDYSSEVLREIMSGNDCKIDDPDLVTLGSDKAKLLASKTSPLALINILIAKWKHAGHHIQLNEMWETKDEESHRSVWNWKIGLVEKNIFGQAGDFNKQRARQ